MSDTNFSIPIKWNLDYVDNIIALETPGRRISDFYGCIEIPELRNGRKPLDFQNITFNKAGEITNYLKSKNKGFRYLLNSPDPRSLNNNDLEEKNVLARIIEELNINTFVCTSPRIMKIVRELDPNLNIQLSTICSIKEPSNINRYLEYAPNKLVPQHDIPKSPLLLRALLDFCNNQRIEIEIMVTESCLYQCPVMGLHYQALADKKNDDDFHKYCLDERIKDPINFFSPGSFIPPEDISIYTNLGINQFKISGRSKSEKYLLNVAKAYLSGGYYGNLVDLMGISNDSHAEEWIYIHSDSYRGMIEEIYSNKHASPDSIISKYYKKAVSNNHIRISTELMPVNKQIRLDEIKARVNKSTTDIPFLGFSKMRPLPELNDIFDLMLGKDPNHVLFNERVKSTDNKDSSLILEEETVEWVIKQYSAKDFTGRFTSGGTENNITALWMAREHLLKANSIYHPIVLKTNLTHYSVEKSCHILSLAHHDIPIDDNYTMSSDKLSNYLLTSINKNIILVLTLGYTTTGTSDDFQEINKVVKNYKQLGFNIIVHIDGAISGLSQPFLKSNPLRLDQLDIDSLSLDFHKMGFAPYNSSVHIFRNGFLNLISVNVPYARNIKDTALLSSRSGAIAVYCWAVIKYLGDSGFIDIYLKCRDIRDYCVTQMRPMTFVRIFSIPDDSPSLFFYITADNYNFDKLEKFFGLDPFSIGQLGHHCYRVYINNNITMHDVDFFISELWNNNNDH
jgi:hypothetical protein